MLGCVLFNFSFVEECVTSLTMTPHPCLTFAGEVTDKDVLRSSSKISSLCNHGLLHYLHPIDDYSCFGSNEKTVDVSIALSQLGKNTVRSS